MSAKKDKMPFNLTELEMAIEHHNEPMIKLHRQGFDDIDITLLIWNLIKRYKANAASLERIKLELTEF